MNNKFQERVLAVDLVRVIAIFLVIWQHASEFYYIGPGVSLVQENAVAIGLIDSLARACIGLFVMITGYFLLPMQDTTDAFFRKRFSRVVFPWLFWCVAYAVYNMARNDEPIEQALIHILHIPLNWGTEVGHLWYVYMLVGLYLLIPILSPWLRGCSKRELQVYLGIWSLTLFLPYIHGFVGQVWGECTWNASPMLHYFTGFIGYLLLGHYVRRYGVLSATFAWLVLLLGYAITAGVFCLRAPFVTGAVEAEIPWDFCSVNVAMMVWGIFSLLSRVRLREGGLLARIVVSVSLCSYGMYLTHIIVLNAFHDALDALSDSVWVNVPLIAVPTFVLTYLLVLLLARLPKAKWWLGVG